MDTTALICALIVIFIPIIIGWLIIVYACTYLVLIGELTFNFKQQI